MSFRVSSVSKEADAEASNVYADIYIGDSEVGKKGSVFRHPVTKEAANVSDTSNITQGTYVYFITDTTLDPKNTDTEWNIKISYRSIRPFLTKDTPILLVPEETILLTAPDSPSVVSDKIKIAPKLSFKGDLRGSTLIQIYKYIPHLIIT